MATITTRSGKGSPLTNSEVDSNFTNLNTDKVELNDISVGSNASASGSGGIAYANATGVFTYTPPDLSGYLTSVGSITFSNIDGASVLLSSESFVDSDTQLMTAAAIDDRINSKGYITSYTVTVGDVTQHQSSLSIAASQISGLSSSIANVSEDTTPQLGGNLDVNGHDIVTTGSAAIELDPNGYGVVIFKGNSSRGAGQFKLNCEANSHGITIKGPPHSANASYTLTLPNDDGSANQVLKTDGSGSLSWVAQTTAYGDSDVDTHLNISGASSNQVLSWTGSDYSWVAQSGGGGGLSDVVSDTTPQLGGDLDVNSNSIVSASNGNIAITPNGTGKIVLDGLSWPTSDGSANQVLKTDGSGQLSFVAQSGGGGGASVSISDSAPSSPSSGDLWWDSSQAMLFIYYADGSSNQWVKANPSGSASGVSTGKAIAMAMIFGG